MKVEVKVTETPVREQSVWWSPPHGDCFKVNVDGTTFSKQKGIGHGVVIRDDKERVEAAQSRRIEVPFGAVEVEAKAWEAGLLFAKDVGVHEIVLEGNSLVICNALCGASPPPASVASIVLGCKICIGNL